VRVDERTGVATAVAPGAAIVRAVVGEARAALSLSVSRPIPATVPAGPLVQPPTPPPPVAAPRRRRHWPWIVGGIAVAVAAGGGLGIALWAPPAPDAEPAPTTTVIVPARGIRWVTIEGTHDLRVGQRVRLKGIAYDAHQRPVSGTTFVWSSDDPTVVTVDRETGRVAAVAPGAAQVRASAGGREATVSVTVRE
jgi:hypothetical protein